MPAILLAPVLGACLPFAVEVDFSAFPPPDRFPRLGRYHSYRYVVQSAAGRFGDEVRVFPYPNPLRWAEYFTTAVAPDGGEAVGLGPVTTILAVYGQPVTAVEYQSAFVRPAIRWVVRPDHLFAPAPKK